MHDVIVLARSLRVSNWLYVFGSVRQPSFDAVMF
jgi:hypothetical protein